MSTEVMFILDRSGSMSSCAEDAVGGFNEYLKGLDKKVRLTLLQFDTVIDYTYESQKPKDCKPLVLGKTYQPRGCTALLDAIGVGLDKIGDAEKAVVAIYTDGYENSSQEWSAKGVKKALKRARKKGWEVIFLAADIDTTFATQTLGMPASKVAQVSNTTMTANMATIGDYTRSYAASGMAKTTNLQDDYEAAKNSDAST